MVCFKHPIVFVTKNFFTYPKPDNSGVYLPQPNRGGKDNAIEYSQMEKMIFNDAEYDLSQIGVYD